MTFITKIILATAICLIGSRSWAQGIYGYTVIDVDSSTNVVTAVCETDTDGETQGYYETIVRCTVRDAAGNEVAYNQSTDYGGYAGFAQVILTFTGAPGTTYTATGGDLAVPVIPYDAPEGSPDAYYEDEFNLTSLEEGVPPTYLYNYDWLGPGPGTETTGKVITLGNTTDMGAIAPNIVITFTGTKSVGDNIEFIWGNDCSEALGLVACYPSMFSQITANWRWNIEVSAQVKRRCQQMDSSSERPHIERHGANCRFQWS